MLPDRSALEGVEWIVAEHLDPNGALTPIADRVRASLHFSDGRVRGSGGCNRFMGTYEAGEEALAIGQMKVTRMACGPEADAVERAVLAALDVAAGFAVTDSTLALIDAAGDTILRLEASTLGLVGTDWTALMINNGRGAVTSLVTGTRVELRFGEDEQLTGFGGCNRVFGPYQVDGDAIRIGPVASTRMACTEPDGVMEQEEALLAALERATAWSIHDGRLELRDADGALQVQLVPA